MIYLKNGSLKKSILNFANIFLVLIEEVPILQFYQNWENIRYIYPYQYLFFSFWHRFQNKEDNSRLSNALKESIYLNNSGVNSWFSSITFLSQKLGIHLTKSKLVGKLNFKTQIKKFAKEDFLKQSSKDSGKLTTYFVVKDHFRIEKYLSIHPINFNIDTDNKCTQFTYRNWQIYMKENQTKKIN